MTPDTRCRGDEPVRLVHRIRGWLSSFTRMATMSVFAACDVPTLYVHGQPNDVALYRDGRAVGTGSHTEPLPYFGTVEVVATSARADAASTAPLANTPAPTRAVTTAQIDPPVPGWMFPFDFVVEVVSLPWRGSQRSEIAVALPTRQPIPDGVVPTTITELLRRSDAMRRER